MPNPQQPQGALVGPGNTNYNQSSPGYYGNTGNTVSPVGGTSLNPLYSSNAVNITDVDPSGTIGGQYLQAQQQGSQAAQQQALKAAQDLYQGKGPSLATQLLQQQANRSMSNQNAMASSSSGSGSALARRQAMMTNAGTMQDLGSQAGTARAQEQLGALSQMGQLAGQSRAQDMALAGGEEGIVQNQAGLNLQNYGIQKNAEAQGNALGMQGLGTALAAAGTIAMFADMPGNASGEAAGLSLKEPGGPSHWIIREEPNFLLAANARTGELRKILTAPLTPEEHSQAMKKHGAGPVGSSNPANLQVRPGGGMVRGGDVDMGAATDAVSNAASDTSDDAASAGYNVSQGAGTAGYQASQSTSGPKSNAVSAGLNKAGDKLSATKMPASYQPGSFASSDPGAMGEAAAKAVARGGDVSLGGGQPQSYGQAFRQQYIDSSAKTETEAGDLTIGGDQSAPQQTGADKLIAQMQRDPNAGYSAANLRNTVNTDAAAKQSDEQVMQMSPLQFGQWLSQNMPNVGVDEDVGKLQQSIRLNQTVDSSPTADKDTNYASRPTTLPSPGIDPNIDNSAKGPRNLDRGGPATGEGGGGAVEMPALREGSQKSKSNYNAVSADFGLGKGKFNVNPPKAKNTMPKTGGALRGLTSFYGRGPALDSPSKANSMLTKSFSKPRFGKKAA